MGTLKALSERNASYARFQLTSPLQVDEMVSVLAHADPASITLIEKVLEPYVDTTRARLDALERLRRVATNFVENLNAFYVGKYVTFDVNEGVRIRTTGGNQLSPDHLSSGEQQLLLIFCHVLMARPGQNTFLIDEPELSLNVKWQRKLIQALFDIVQDAEVQFIFATHSVGFLSEHLCHVLQLEQPLGARASRCRLE